MGRVKLLKASAGSGKTYQLAYEYVRAVISDPTLYRNILAVTFTNKATEEMKRRIVEEINILATGRKSNYMSDLESALKLAPEIIRKRAELARTKILHDYSRFAVLTIDKFFQRIIRSFIKELGIDMNFNLELQTDSLLSSAADALIDNIAVNDSLRRWIAEFIEERIEEGKKWDIKSGLTALGYEVFKEGYKRSSRKISKEELGRIVSEASAKAAEVLHTMRQKAATALEIMDDYSLSVSDFANKDKGVAGYLQRVAGGDIRPYGAFVRKALAGDEGWYTKTSPRIGDIKSAVHKLRPILEEICAAYDQNIGLINSTELMRENYRNFALLTDLSQKIEDLCAEQSIMPISETNHILHKLISGNDTPFIFEKAGNHFSRFMIDEFQDTSAMQWENFTPLLQNAVSQTAENDTPVLLVGDVKQSIYRWRGGDWKILAGEIESEFGDIISTNLTTNYRSFSNIIEFNNAITSGCVAADNDMLDAELDQAYGEGFVSSETKARLQGMLEKAYAGHTQQANSQNRQGYIDITMYEPDENGEKIPPVISHVEQLQDRGYTPGEIAILVRGNREGAKIANMLLEHKRRNPGSKYCYDVVTAEALTIGSSPVAGYILACLKLASSPLDSINLAIYNKWHGRAFDAPLPAAESAFINSLILKPLQEAYEAISIFYSLNGNPDCVAYLQAMHEQVVTFSNTTISDIPLFVKWWEEKGAAQSVYVPQGKSAITIITIHKSKGLEYKVVLIPFCNWSLNPKPKSILWAKGASAADGDLGELGDFPVGFVKKMGASYFSEAYFDELVMSHIDNINIFYVAITRAREELHIMMPANSAKRAGSGIDSLISKCISVSGDSVAIGAMQGTVASDADGNTVYRFGEPCVGTVSPSPGGEAVIYSKYASYATKGRLKLRMPSQRYIDEGVTDLTLSPRNFGILMHRIFEKSDNISDVGKSIDRMNNNGGISQEEIAALRDRLEAALANDLVASWFDGSWEVRNENDIIIPGIGSTRRPDRVMVKNNRAVVVDYKFGLARKPAYARQIKEYMDLLRGMGYENVSGYIWYVSLDDIEEVA